MCKMKTDKSFRTILRVIYIKAKFCLNHQNTKIAVSGLQSCRIPLEVSRISIGFLDVCYLFKSSLDINCFGSQYDRIHHTLIYLSPSKKQNFHKYSKNFAFWFLS